MEKYSIEPQHEPSCSYHGARRQVGDDHEDRRRVARKRRLQLARFFRYTPMHKRHTLESYTPLELELKFVRVHKNTQEFQIVLCDFNKKSIRIHQRRTGRGRGGGLVTLYFFQRDVCSSRASFATPLHTFENSCRMLYANIELDISGVCILLKTHCRMLYATVRKSLDSAAFQEVTFSCECRAKATSSWQR